MVWVEGRTAAEHFVGQHLVGQCNMVFAIGKLEKTNDKWQIVYPDGFAHELENAVAYSAVFIEHDGWWEEVYCGETERFSGEVHGKKYEGVVICISGTSIVIPVPGVPAGKWVARCVYRDEYWELEPGMLVRTPYSGGEYASGTFALEPKGSAVCTIIWQKETDRINLGKVGFDLSRMPFPQEMWFYHEQKYQESELELKWGVDDMRFTAEFFGWHDMETLFWLF